MRTLIVAQGLERERILAAISIHAPNRVLVLRNQNEATPEIKKEVEKQIQALKKEVLPTRGARPYPFVSELDTKTHQIDFFDFATSFARIQKLVKAEKEAGNEVHIDLSTGNKIASAALFLAAQVENVPLTYCKAGKYSQDKNVIAALAKEPVEVPSFPLRLEALPIELLQALKKHSGADSISDLIRKQGARSTKANIISTSRKLEWLSERGYVTLAREGKRKRIALTVLGEKMAGLS